MKYFSQIFPGFTFLKLYAWIILITAPLGLFAQTGLITGTVTTAISNQPVAGATVSMPSHYRGTVTDSLGRFKINNVLPGVYNLTVSAIGFREKYVFDIQVTIARPTEIDFLLDENVTTLSEVKVTPPRFNKTLESPVSLHSIGATEVNRNPGGNRDVSKVIQSLPGVSTSTTFRNDIIIRGGSPSENKFYLDDIEIPNINHFSTQGASGGPVGMINVDFIKSVDLYSGAFPANRGNALSSVIEFHLKDGVSDKLHEKFSLGSSDLSATVEGPAGKNTTFLTSYRYSYLQGLFKLLNIPFLPAYQDFQFKIKTKLDSKNEVTLIGLGAIDRFNINADVPKTEINEYTLANIPYNGQNNYTIGATLKHFASNGHTTIVISRDYLENIARKFKDNNPSDVKTLDYSSREIENKLRVDKVVVFNHYRLNIEGGLTQSNYRTYTFNLLPYGNYNYQSAINFWQYGFSAQLSRAYFDEKLNLSFGVRDDANSFSSNMEKLLMTLSPRFSAAYNFTEKFSLNFNTGIYFEMPSYTLMGFKDSTSKLTNRNVSYISNQQVVLGVEYNDMGHTMISIEGFYKYYPNYPMVRILGDTVSLADQGNSYIVSGNYPVVSSSIGRSYGVELFAQEKLNHGFYGIFALTLFTSEFKDKQGVYRPSSWDSRYILSITAGKLFNKSWEVGAKLRITGGSPYTPYNISESSLKVNYDIAPGGIPDYNQLNALRLKGFYQADIRIDKKFPFKKFTLNIYADIQNLTGLQYQQPPVLVPDKDSNGNLQDWPGDPTRIKMKLLNNPSGNITPSIGVIFEL